MELSSCNIKKFLIISQKKAFFIFREMELSYILGNRNSEKNPIFRKKETPQKFFIFQETELFYISGNGNHKKLIFRDMELSSPELKKLLLLGEPLVHHCFYRCFHFSPLFSTTVFWVFLLLIAFFHFSAFMSGTLFLCCCTASGTDFKDLFLLSGVFYLTLLSHICHITASARDLRELFFSQAFFTLHSFPLFGRTYFYQGFPGSPQFFLEGSKASH